MITTKKLWSLLAIMMAAAVSVGITSCGGDDDGPSGNNGGDGGGGSTANEQVFTGTTTNVTSTAATITCNFSSASSASALQLGVLYSTERSSVDNYQGVLSLSTIAQGAAIRWNSASCSQTPSTTTAPTW